MTTSAIKRVLRVLYLGQHGIHAVSDLEDRIRVYYFREVPEEIRAEIEQLAKPFTVEWKESPPAEAAVI